MRVELWVHTGKEKYKFVVGNQAKISSFYFKIANFLDFLVGWGGGQGSYSYGLCCYKIKRFVVFSCIMSQNIEGLHLVSTCINFYKRLLLPINKTQKQNKTNRQNKGLQFLANGILKSGAFHTLFTCFSYTFHALFVHLSCAFHVLLLGFIGVFSLPKPKI